MDHQETKSLLPVQNRIPISPSLVQAKETTRSTANPGSYRSFLADLDSTVSQASQDFYEQIDDSGSSSYSERLVTCRTKAWFVRHDDTGQVRIASEKCKLRWCFFCSQTKQKYITMEVTKWLEHAENPKLLTLTVKHSSAPLPDQIKFLYDCFVKYRKRKLLTNAIAGGVWFFQITFNKETEEWHPHIHALLDARYMPHEELKNLWSKITRGSHIVHIRVVNDPERTVAHNARYAATPASLLGIPEDHWVEMFLAFHGRRLCGTWGTAKKISLKPERPKDADKWRNVGSWSVVINLKGEDPFADAILNAWAFDKPLDKKVTLNELDRQLDGWGINDPPEETPGFKQLIFF